MTSRSPRQIATEICQLWKSPNFGAKPYIKAMLTLESVDQNYGFDSGRSIINYFLSNAGTWKGEDAKRIKSELRQLVK